MLTWAKKEPINTGRQLELDIAKGLAIVFMIWVHALELFAEGHESMSLTAYNIIQVLGSPFSAPVFMFAMGVGLVYSRKATPALLARRGLFLLGLGYGLNLLRAVLPLALNNLEALGTSAVIGLMVTELICIDILAFAGFFFLFWALFRKLGLKDYWLIALWLVCGIARLLLENVQVTAVPLRALTAYFWGSCGDAYFPFILWMFYPVLGYFFGNVLIRTENKNKLYRNTFLIGLIAFAVTSVIIVGYSIQIGQSDAFSYDYYHHGIAGNLWCGSIVLMWLPCCYGLSLLSKGPVARMFMRWSKNVNALYCFQWLILGGLQFVLFAQREASLLELSLFCLGVLVISDGLSDLYMKGYRRVKAGLGDAGRAQGA